MQFSRLGTSGLSVSRICLGTMTWGKQNTQAEADEQIEHALSVGINFFDTAEMYAVPPTAETYGKTEEIIGNWLARNPSRRSEMIIATKIAGIGLPWVRSGGPITGKAVIEAVDNSLKRLQTDYIDLYQLHWPNRTSPHFGKHTPNFFKFSDIKAAEHEAQMLDILKGLAQCISDGKIRHFGLSDDTTWGINTYLKLSRQHDLPKPVSIQNEFSLLHAKDWPYLIENCVHEEIAYLPWSPLASGLLSGKYADGAMPKGSRWSISNPAALHRNTPQAHEAVAEYVKLAKQFGYTPSQLALAWCDQVDGVTSTIIGATSMDQLKEDITAFDMLLSEELQTELAAVFKRYPQPF